MKSKYYYGWCYFKNSCPPNSYRKGYRTIRDNKKTIILSYQGNIDGKYYKLIEINAIRVKNYSKALNKAF